jgi:hypothetical protein
MIITKTISINDEPLKAKSSGKRTAELKYLGERFVYAEVCGQTNKILTMVHLSEEPQLEIALERLTPDCDRYIIEVDATDKTLLAAIISDNYDLSVDDYNENLSDGSVFVYNYSKPNQLCDIFSVHNMTYSKSKKDFDEYLYLINDISTEEFKNSVNEIISKTDIALKNNSYSTSDTLKINEFLTELNAILEKVDQGIDHWKLKFPVCETQL